METAFIRAVFQMEIFNFISLRSCSAVWERVGERGLDWIGVCVCVFYVCTCGVCVCVEWTYHEQVSNGCSTEMKQAASH